MDAAPEIVGLSRREEVVGFWLGRDCTKVNLAESPSRGPHNEPKWTSTSGTSTKTQQRYSLVYKFFEMPPPLSYWGIELAQGHGQRRENMGIECVRGNRFYRLSVRSLALPTSSFLT